MQTSLTCETGQQILEQTAGFLGRDIYKYDVTVNPYTDIVTQEPYDLSEGANQKYTVMGRPDLIDTPWNPVGVTDPVAQTTRCEGVVTEIGLNGLDTKSPLFYEKTLKTPVFCYEDIINGAGTTGDKILKAYIAGLKKHSSWELFRFHQRGIFLGSGIKGVSDNVNGFTATYSDSSTTYPAQAPTAPISIGMLEGIVQSLFDNGVADDPYDTINGTPVAPIYLSYEAFYSTLRSDPQFRKDLHYSDKANTLIGPLKSAQGFGRLMFMIMNDVRRFTYAGGVFTEVPPYIKQGVDSLGRAKTIRNPMWTNPQTAPFEEVQIPNKNSYVAMIPTNTLKPPAEMDYPEQAKTFRGEWHFDVPDFYYCPQMVTTGGVSVVQSLQVQNLRKNQGFFWNYTKIGQAFPQPNLSASFLIMRCPYGPVAASCNANGY